MDPMTPAEPSTASPVDRVLLEVYHHIGAIQVADAASRSARQCALIKLARLRSLLPSLDGDTPSTGETQ